MSTLNNGSLPALVDLTTIKFLDEVQSLDASLMLTSWMVKVEDIPANTGDTKRFSEIDLEEYASNKNEWDQSDQALVQQGHTKDMVFKRVSKDISITYEMRTQNKYTEVVRRLTNLAKLIPNRMDLDLAHRITFATDTSYTDKDGATVDTTTGDSLAWASTAHTLTGSATTYRNILAGNPQFSKGSLESIEKLGVEETFNNFWEKMAMNFDVIFCSDDPNTNNNIDEVINSTASPDGLNEGVINVNQGRYRKVRIPRLATTATGAVDSTKAKRWGIIDAGNSDFMMGITERPRLKTPALGNNGEDFSTDDWNFGARWGYGIVVVSGRSAKFSKWDGTS